MGQPRVGVTLTVRHGVTTLLEHGRNGRAAMAPAFETKSVRLFFPTSWTTRFVASFACAAHLSARRSDQSGRPAGSRW